MEELIQNFMITTEGGHGGGLLPRRKIQRGFRILHRIQRGGVPQISAAPLLTTFPFLKKCVSEEWSLTYPPFASLDFVMGECDR